MENTGKKPGGTQGNGKGEKWHKMKALQFALLLNHSAFILKYMANALYFIWGKYQWQFKVSGF